MRENCRVGAGMQVSNRAETLQGSVVAHEDTGTDLQPHSPRGLVRLLEIHFLAERKLLTSSTRVKSGLQGSNRAETSQGSFAVHAKRQGPMCSPTALVVFSGYTKFTFWLRENC